MPKSTSWIAFEGAMRGLALILLPAVLEFFANSANLQGWVPTAVIGVITVLAATLENLIKENGGGALFGAIK